MSLDETHTNMPAPLQCCRTAHMSAQPDCGPAHAQAGELMGVLLGGLARLGMNALLVRRMVAAMATRAGGRAALRMGVTLWQRKAGSATAGESDAKAALQWAVAHLWQIGRPLPKKPGLCVRGYTLCEMMLQPACEAGASLLTWQTRRCECGRFVSPVIVNGPWLLQVRMQLQRRV